MQVSLKTRGLLETWEGVELKMYKDSAGLPTIGVGHLLTKSELASGQIFIGGKAVSYTQGLTREQVDALLSQDLLPAEATVNKSVVVPLNQNQFDALVSFTFNVGDEAFINSTLLKLLNQGQYDQVPAQLMRWDRAGDQVVQGLINRRTNEVKLWNGEI